MSDIEAVVPVVEKSADEVIADLKSRVEALEAKLEGNALVQFVQDGLVAKIVAKAKELGVVVDTDVADLVAKLKAVGIVKDVEVAEVKVEGFFARLHAELGKVVGKIEEVPEELKADVVGLWDKLKAHL